MRTLIQSETTVVPPVTAERSPPLSRITGADSPVMADSLTEATPSTISPSAGTMSPASTSTTSPGLQLVRRGTGSNGRRASTISAWPSFRSRVRAQGVGRGLAAAFGDALGEVGEQHREPEPERDLEGEAEVGAPCTKSSTDETVASTATTSVARMTGLRGQLARVELDEDCADRRRQDRRIEQCVDAEPRV